MLDPTYHLGYCLLTEIDYATAEQRVVCRVPGCGHDTDACPAYFPGKGRELCVFTVGETLYVYRPVVTMHYEGSWDDYYAEVVAPKLQERPQGWETLTDEELLAYCRGRYAEQSAPAGLYVIEGGGTSPTGADLYAGPGKHHHALVRRRGAVRLCLRRAAHRQLGRGTASRWPTAA